MPKLAARRYYGGKSSHSGTQTGAWIASLLPYVNNSWTEVLWTNYTPESTAAPLFDSLVVPDIFRQ